MKYRIFNSAGQCEAYCAQAYVAMVREHAATLTRQEMDDHWNLPSRARIPDLPDSALVGSRFPIYGRNAASGEWNRTGGFTRAWDSPRLTADGRWAAQAFNENDPDAQPEPAWPASPDGEI